MSEPEELETGGESRDIAVIGMAGRFPRAARLEDFWRNLADGVEAITFLSDEELAAAGVSRELLQHPNYVKAASLLDGVDTFDAPFFGYSAREAEIMDPQQRLFLEHAWEALEGAGYVPERFEGLIGVYAGVAWNTYLLSNLTSNRELFEGGGGFQVFITNDKDFMPTRVSYKLNLKGPSVVVQTSCSTSLVAIHLACLSLLNYECDMALAGGVTVRVPQKEGYFHHEGGLSSPDGHCRAFDARAAGTIFGSGIGVVVLKRLSEALDDGDPIRAVIKGSAINNDGSVKVSYTAPSVEGQAGVIAAAHAIAGFESGEDLETLRYVECHGTGTSLGDPIEVTALTKAFREHTDRRAFCALGSVKTNLGHLDAAAGVAGFIKTVLALEHRQLPPSLHFEEPNPVIDFANSPFFVNTALREWETEDGAPRRAGVSSFGVGGTNAHVILEEAPEPEPSGPSRPWQLLRLSARSETALQAATANLRAWLEENEEASLPDVAYTLALGRSVFRHRQVLVCRDRDEALSLLAGENAPRLLTETDAEDPRDRPVVFLFSGQGSQHHGMARELSETEAVFRQEMDRCAELLRPRLGLDLRRVLWPAPGSEEEAARQLARTALTQPALFAVEYALARLWMSWGVRPQAMLGHSIGEYVAACLAGVFSLEDALALVAARGRLMQDLPAGGMLSVPLPEEELAPLLGPHLSIAAVNEPARTAVSGPFGALEELERDLTARGVEYRRLQTSHAFHSTMMEPALQPFLAEVRRLRLQPPAVPFLSNVTGTWITPEQATDPEYWARHLRQPVRFAAGVAELLRDPRRILLEVGPGRTLATLAARHPGRTGQPVLASLRHPQDDTSDLRMMLEALGRLWLSGLAVDPAAFYGGEHRRRVALPTYPFERQRYWIDPKPLALVEPAASRPGTPVKRADLADWFYLPSWKPSLATGTAESTGPRRWLVLAHRSGPSARLAELLSHRQAEVVTVHPGDDFEQRLASLASDAPLTVLHAWALGWDLPAASDAPGFEAAQEQGFHALVSLARTLGRRPGPVDLLVVADGLAALTAAEPTAPEKATLLGLLKVLPQELPHVTCRAIDVALPPSGSRQESALLERLLAEISHSPSDELVVLRGRERWVPDFEPVRLDSRSTLLREGGVYLLTGALAGNGFALARLLARDARARLVLLEPPSTPGGGGGPDRPAQATGSVGAGEGGAHTKEPSRDDPAPRAGGDRHARIGLLESLGASVLLLETDLADESDLRRALAEAEAHFGPLHGVIHAASTQGERTFRALAELGPEEAAWHFRPKAHALYSLDRVLAGRHLDFFAVISSLATVLGGVAYGAYAAANAFLDAFVRERNRQEGSSWLALDWDVWQFEDETEQILAVREDLAGLAMTPREGEETFRRALAAPADRLLVSTADLAARLAQRRERIEAARGRHTQVPSQGTAGTMTSKALHPRPLQTPYTPPETELERRIVEVWQRTLGFEQIGVHDNFFELGGDSFLAIQVVAKIKEELQVDLPVARLYQGLTVRALAILLDEEKAAGQRAAQLEERRESMGKRKQFLEQRRAGRKTEVS
ncbi:MAG TPA: beta-ketoacyl synthase N-terminal-like domain-containing protein [Thermoanaerobaculia bacterium]|nr:beta-ketoacyl synthase N-terminal-like domain-containing protein [Thermoanaerobaculia bacterium]